MSNPYDPHNAPTEFPGSGHQPPQQPPPPPPYQQPPPPPYQQQPPTPGGGYGGGPGGPGFGAPGGYGGPGGYGEPPKKSKLPLIIGAAVLALVLVVGAVIGGVVLLGGDDGDDEKASDDTSETTDEPEPPSEEPTANDDPVEPSPAVPESPEAPTDPGDFDEAVFPVVGFWNGTYVCAQGTSSLELVIAPSGRGGDSLDGVFTFGPTSANPEVPEGSFLMEGNFIDGVLSLSGTTWVTQPPGYVLIDIVADVEGDRPETISGEITTEGCDSFSVSR